MSHGHHQPRRAAFCSDRTVSHSSAPPLPLLPAPSRPSRRSHWQSRRPSPRLVWTTCPAQKVSHIGLGAAQGPPPLSTTDRPPFSIVSLPCDANRCTMIDVFVALALNHRYHYSTWIDKSFDSRVRDAWGTVGKDDERGICGYSETIKRTDKQAKQQESIMAFTSSLTPSPAPRQQPCERAPSHSHSHPYLHPHLHLSPSPSPSPSQRAQAWPPHEHPTAPP